MIRRVQNYYDAWVCAIKDINKICTHHLLAYCRLPLFNTFIHGYIYNPENPIDENELILTMPWFYFDRKFDLKFVEEVNKRWNEFYENKH